MVGAVLRELGQTVKVPLAVVAGEDGLVLQVLVLVPVLAAARLTVLGVAGWDVWTERAQRTSFQTASWGGGDELRGRGRGRGRG